VATEFFFILEPGDQGTLICVYSVTVLEATVNTLIKDEEEDTVVGVIALTTDRTEIRAYAPLTIVADGLFSKFRKEITELTPDVRSNFVG
jgi:squalene monooxygenase